MLKKKRGRLRKRPGKTQLLTKMENTFRLWLKPKRRLLNFSRCLWQASRPSKKKLQMNKLSWLPNQQSPLNLSSKRRMTVILKLSKK